MQVEGRSKSWRVENVERRKQRIESCLPADLRMNFRRLQNIRTELLPTSVVDLHALPLGDEEIFLRKMKKVRTLREKLDKKLPSCLTWDIVEKVLRKATPDTVEQIVDASGAMYVVDKTAKNCGMLEHRVTLAKFQCQLESHAVLLDVEEAGKHG
jgi:hypothetical protein